MILWAMVVVAAACVFSLLLLIVAAERTLERLERENRLLRERIAEAGRSAARRWEPASPISVRPKLRLTKLDEKSASESRKRAREIIEAHAKQRGG